MLLLAKCVIGFVAGGLIGHSVKPNVKYLIFGLLGLLLGQLAMVI